MSAATNNHYLVPIAISESPLIRILRGIEGPDGGDPIFAIPQFDVDHADNFLSLPTGTETRRMARHIGSHPAYNEFVGKILDQIKVEADQKIAGGTTTLQAYEEAAENVRHFQLWLKDNLIAKVQPE